MLNRDGVAYLSGGDYLILQKMMESVLHRQLECQLKKYNYKNLEVIAIEPRITHKSELPAGE